MGQIALFDMDNTLYDYEGALRKGLAEIRGPGEPDYSDPAEAQVTPIWDIPFLRARMQLIKQVPNFWRDLPKLRMGWDILRTAIMARYEIHILTKGPKGLPQAWAEKVEAIRRDFDGIQPTSIHITENKSLVYGRVLVDDWPEYIEGWLRYRPRGTVIMPVHAYNKNYRHPQVLPYNGEDIKAVAKALDEAYDR